MISVGGGVGQPADFCPGQGNLARIQRAAGDFYLLISKARFRLRTVRLITCVYVCEK